ncbi:hypothetical protein JMN32_15550 [Fulvivirga sp. 29W222]|uniref:Uncharacterized protein n=1 Tax=Fulvivirga marina TaxID=2494733 RepID=A0A937FZA8_9BACT|nr:hypothetical protein [Fulvivirga marina]MBL6447733.1 hypothetical protein [Fulvivirga marina]
MKNVSMDRKAHPKRIHPAHIPKRMLNRIRGMMTGRIFRFCISGTS